MKLSEIKLFEEPIETKNAEDVWAEGEGDAASYITSTVYYVKPAAKAGYFDVTYDDDNDQRKTYGTMTKQDLDSAFTPLRGNQKADAEERQEAAHFLIEQFGIEHTKRTYHDSHTGGQPEWTENRSPVTLPNVVPTEPEPKPPSPQAGDNVSKCRDARMTPAPMGN